MDGPWTDPVLRREHRRLIGRTRSAAVADDAWDMAWTTLPPLLAAVTVAPTDAGIMAWIAIASTCAAMACSGIVLVHPRWRDDDRRPGPRPGGPRAAVAMAIGSIVAIIVAGDGVGWMRAAMIAAVGVWACVGMGWPFPIIHGFTPSGRRPRIDLLASIAAVDRRRAMRMLGRIAMHGIPIAIGGPLGGTVAGVAAASILPRPSDHRRPRDDDGRGAPTIAVAIAVATRGTWLDHDHDLRSAAPTAHLAMDMGDGSAWMRLPHAVMLAPRTMELIAWRWVHGAEVRFEPRSDASDGLATAWEDALIAAVGRIAAAMDATKLDMSAIPGHLMLRVLATVSGGGPNEDRTDATS